MQEPQNNATWKTTNSQAFYESLFDEPKGTGPNIEAELQIRIFFPPNFILDAHGVNL